MKRVSAGIKRARSCCECIRGSKIFVRGAVAAIFFSFIASVGSAQASQTMEQQFSNGATLVARRAGAAPVAALEVWIRCPSSDYDGTRPGISRLAALALVEEKSATSLSLRDATRIAGGRLGVSVYGEAAEIAIVAPSYAAAALLEKLSATMGHPYVDQAAFDTARTRLAAGQVAAGEVVDQEVRDALFAQMFVGGPLRDSSYGTPKSLRDMTLQDVTAFVGRAYVPGNEIAIVVGDIDSTDVAKHMTAFGSSGPAPQPMPESPVAVYSGGPFALHDDQAEENGVGLAWVGPPISDQRAATAMDFLSDYLTNPDGGVLVKAVQGVDNDADFTGQFVTLRNPGVFFVTVAGTRFDPALLPSFVRSTLQGAVGHQLSKDAFERARSAYVTHLLRDLQTDQDLADNYGWYYAQGALNYSPSYADLALSGDYFAQVSSLTPDYVYSIARKYLLAKPAIVVLPRSTK
jgi:predicted Zn-dependent peptidase